jgi:hypothetical protein
MMMFFVPLKSMEVQPSKEPNEDAIVLNCLEYLEKNYPEVHKEFSSHTQVATFKCDLNKISIFFNHENSLITPEVYSLIQKYFGDHNLPVSPDYYKSFFKKIINLTNLIQSNDMSKPCKKIGIAFFNSYYDYNTRQAIREFWSRFHVTKTLRIHYNPLDNSIYKKGLSLRYYILDTITNIEKTKIEKKLYNKLIFQGQP